MKEQDDQQRCSSRTGLRFSNEMLHDPEYKVVQYASLPTIIEEIHESCPTEPFQELEETDMEHLVHMMMNDESQSEDLAQGRELRMPDPVQNRSEDPVTMAHQMKQELAQIHFRFALASCHDSEQVIVSAQAHQALQYLALRWHMCSQRVLMKRFQCWRWQTLVKGTHERQALDRLERLLHHHLQRLVQKRFLQWKWMEQDYLKEQLSLVYQQLTQSRTDLWKMKQQRLRELKVAKPSTFK